MKRYLLILTATILLLTLFLTTPLDVVSLVKGDPTNAQIEWGALQDASQPPGEWDAECNAAWYINYMFPPSGCSWFVEDLYDFDTWNYPPYTVKYSSNVYSTLQWLQSDSIATSNLWIGDFFAQQSPYGNHAWHWTEYGLPRNPQDSVWDTMIWYCTSYTPNPPSKQYFDFIYTCSCGGTYWKPDGTENLNPDLPGSGNDYTEYYHWDDCGYEVGMPYAWTGVGDLSQGYYNYDPYCPYCFIGFQGFSVSLIDTLPPCQNTMYDFLYYFYLLLTGAYDSNHYTVSEALDFASSQVWGQYYTFSDTPLYQSNGYTYDQYDNFQHLGGKYWYEPDYISCCMRVYGNGYYQIPW
jgi:hypothetical protein